MDRTATRLIIVRHGETTWNSEGRHQGHLDSPLTSRGLLQAEALADRLAREQFSGLYSSDLGRAAQTAQIIGARSERSVSIDARLRERNLGIFHGLTKEEMRQRYPKEFETYRKDPDYRIPEGESARERMSQHMEVLEELAAKYAQQQVVIVGHGGVLDSVFRRVLKIPLGRARRFSLANGSLNVVSISESERWRIETWGDVSHLRALAAMDDLLY